MKICDKCGNKLPNELSNTEYPHYVVTEMLIPNFCHTVDLCNNCMQELHKWLRTTEDFDKIRAEIEEHIDKEKLSFGSQFDTGLNFALKIIDKYRVDNEEQDNG